MTTKIVRLADLSDEDREALAQITLPAARSHAPSWIADLEGAREEIAAAMAEHRVGLVVVEEMRPVAWIAAGHDWGAIWEIHPVIVGLEHQGRGHGRHLVTEVERIAATMGACTMALSTSDVVGATSLANVDLYEDLSGHLARFTVHRPHSSAFWLHMGYTIVGVVPDAEGPGRPSIAFARRLARA